MGSWDDRPSWGIDRGPGATVRRGSGMGLVARAAVGTFVGIMALVLALHVIGWAVGVVFFAFKVALVVGLIGLVVAAFRRFA